MNIRDSYYCKSPDNILFLGLFIYAYESVGKLVVSSDEESISLGFMFGFLKAKEGQIVVVKDKKVSISK